MFALQSEHRSVYLVFVVCTGGADGTDEAGALPPPRVGTGESGFPNLPEEIEKPKAIRKSLVSLPPLKAPGSSSEPVRYLDAILRTYFGGYSFA
jgi:hypothetical protein